MEDRDDRIRQVKTTKLRHGNDWYHQMAAKSHENRDKNMYKLASWRRWYPERFDNGQLKKEWEGELNGRNT